MTSNPHGSANIEAFYDAVTGTVSYVVYDRPGGTAAIVDPVLDYDPKSGRTSTAQADRIVDFVRAASLTVGWILETHAHADHLSSARHLRARLGGLVAIGERIGQVQEVFKKLFNFGSGFATDGSQFDHRFADGETFVIGSLQAEALFVPGHTPACIAYRVGDSVFVGDTLFMPDVGTARCDFPGGDARVLYRSIRRLLALPAATRLFMCHDYPPPLRAPRWETTVAAQRAGNIHVHDGIDEDAFVAMRTARDRTLEMPVLIIPSIQVNIRAGALPEPDSNGIRYLKIPLDTLG
jgi:glyoxylase-like metal-dependent hydrolase (beta-lactamase superfamily II)